jgi:hypothetical protein
MRHHNNLGIFAEFVMRTLYRNQFKAISQQPFNNALAVAFHDAALARARI